MPQAASWSVGGGTSCYCPDSRQVTWVDMDDCVKARSLSSFMGYAVLAVFICCLYNCIYMYITVHMPLFYPNFLLHIILSTEGIVLITFCFLCIVLMILIALFIRCTCQKWHNKDVQSINQPCLLSFWPLVMRTSSNGNIFPCNWPFVRGLHRSRWIPHTKASDAELWCFLWFASE